MKREDLPPQFSDLPIPEQVRARIAGEGLGRFVFSRCAGIVIGPPADSGSGRLNNGSGFVLRLGEKYFLGTACHVLDSWRDRIGQGEDVIFQAGGLGLRPDRRESWRDPRADVALIGLNEGEVAQVGVEVCEATLGWPPPLPVVGDFVLFAGYPAAKREQSDRQSIDFGCFTGLVAVASVHDGHISCQFQREHWIVDDRGGAPPLNADLGGMSGGPVLLVRNLAYPLVGLVTQHSSAFEIMRMSALAAIPEIIGAA